MAVLRVEKVKNTLQIRNRTSSINPSDTVRGFKQKMVVYGQLFSVRVLEDKCSF